MGIKETMALVSEIADMYLIEKPYIVGGIPRDVYMKKSIKTTDVDLTTNSSDVLRLGILTAEKMNVVFELSEDGHITVYTDEFDLDFSSHFVSEKVVKFLAGKHFGWEEAFSRDFTINTLHQDLITGEITDPTGMGFDDVNAKIIRTPVPPEITLTDDPRRVYRAVNLAARYGFSISEDIIEFVKNNPDTFSAKNIKDKYIVVKMSKALRENKEYTIKLLKDLNLFKHVPLAGEFKDILIEDRLLVDYLEK